MKIEALNNFTILREEKEKEKVVRGIIIPVTVEKKVLKGKIISRSPMCQQVQEEETVVFRDSSVTRFDLEGNELLVVSERDLLCKIKEE